MATTSAAAISPQSSDVGPVVGGLRDAPLLKLILQPDRSSRLALAGGLAGFALLLAIFWTHVAHFVLTWSTDANYSHGFLVPVISLYFANEAARRGAVRIRGGVRLGIGLLGFSILGRIGTALVPVGALGDVAFVIGLAGILALIAGSSGLRRFAFPVAFLLFMVPLPIALYSAIATPLQLWVSRAASLVLNAVGIPVLCQGNMMTLPGGVRMFVAEACSGMRQLTGFLALTTAVAYLSPRPAWYRAVLVASSVPIAMTANVVRVIVTGWIMYALDPGYASGAFHTIEGLLMMGLGLGLLAGECSLLNWAWPPEAPGTEPATAAEAVPPRSVGMVRRVGIAVGILAVGLAAETAVVAATELPRPPLKQPLASLPPRLGDWVGTDVPVDADIIERAQCDDYLNRQYEDPSRPGRRLTLWINYSSHGLNLRHSPEICLPSGGWEKVEAETRVLEVERAGGASLPLTRLAYRQGELVQGVGFWYYIFGEGRIERFVRGLPITSRSSHGRATRGSGLTVEVFCPGEADADGAGLRDFAAALLDELEAIMPEDRANYFRP